MVLMYTKIRNSNPTGGMVVSMNKKECATPLSYNLSRSHDAQGKHREIIQQMRGVKGKKGQRRNHPVVQQRRINEDE